MLKISLSFICSENQLFHDGCIRSTETQDREGWTLGLVICSIFSAEFLYLPVKIPGITVLLEQGCLAALLPWTPSLAAPQGRWCHNNSHEHDVRGATSFFSFLLSVCISISLSLSRSHSASSKISLMQLALAGVTMTLSLPLICSLTFPLLGPDSVFKMAAGVGLMPFFLCVIRQNEVRMKS